MELESVKLNVNTGHTSSESCCHTIAVSTHIACEDNSESMLSQNPQCAIEMKTRKLSSSGMDSP